MRYDHTTGVKSPGFNSEMTLTPVRWWQLWRLLTGWLNRERELVRLRVTCGMMAEARRSDGIEYHDLEEACRRLMHERDALRERVEMLERNSAILAQRPHRSDGSGAS